MAEKDQSQEKSEEPTQKKLEDAKKKGQVARSKELVIYSMLMMSAIILLFIAPGINNKIEGATINSFTFSSVDVGDSQTMLEDISMWMIVFSDIMTPILLITALVAVVSSIILGGWTMSIESVRPKLEKISPLKGLKRIFSSKGLMELIKSILKVTIVGIASYYLFQYYIPDITMLSAQPIESASNGSMQMLGNFFLIASAALLLIVMIDVPFQIHSTKTELKMTKQDVKDEMKDAEGRPEVKMKRKEVARKLAFSRQMEDVPTADVIITNPTHYAVALKYNGSDDAPVVVAMGTDMLALKIRTIGKQYSVSIVESPPLARSLYYFSEIGSPIHEGLYDAVAKILSYVYQLKGSKDNMATKPKLQEIEIAEELRK